jgi:hypothetical protein
MSRTRKTGRKPTAAERHAHNITLARLFPEPAGKLASVAPCACCGERGRELGPGPEGRGDWCLRCSVRAWDRAAHELAFWDQDGGPDVPSDAAW